MCEIISAGTGQHSAAEHTTYAMQVYESMRDSLGILAVRDNGGTFDYNVYRETDPNEADVARFIENNHDTSQLFIHHGRLATQGAVISDHAHPLEIDCPHCDVDYVIHNGVMWGHEHTRRQYEDAGHVFTTDVDSEVIAHSHGSVPTGFESEGGVAVYGRQPAYILANEKAVYFTTNGAYDLSRYGEMAHSYRRIVPNNHERYDEVILSPSDN